MMSAGVIAVVAGDGKSWPAGAAPPKSTAPWFTWLRSMVTGQALKWP